MTSATDSSGTETDSWRQFAPASKTRFGSGVAVFIEDDCTVKARAVGGHPGAYVADIAAVMTLHGSLDQLDRLAREMTVAVDALRPAPTLDQFVAGCVADVVDGR